MNVKSSPTAEAGARGSNLAPAFFFGEDYRHKVNILAIIFDKI